MPAAVIEVGAGNSLGWIGLGKMLQDDAHVVSLNLGIECCRVCDFHHGERVSGLIEFEEGEDGF